MSEQYSELACAIVDLAASRGAKSINALPGAWSMAVDETTFVAVNGKKEDQKVGPLGGMEIDLKPYHFAVWRNGWIVALLTPYDGTVIGGGEDDLIERIRAATVKP